MLLTIVFTLGVGGGGGGGGGGLRYKRIGCCMIDFLSKFTLFCDALQE